MDELKAMMSQMNNHLDHLNTLVKKVVQMSETLYHDDYLDLQNDIIDVKHKISLLERELSKISPH